MKPCSRARGFTLLELLIAMAITATVGVIAWQFLDSALRVSAQSDSVLEEVNTLEQFWQLLEMDLQQSRSSFRFPEEEAAPLTPTVGDFVGGDRLLNTAELLPADAGDMPWLLLLRDVGTNPLQTGRSGLQWVLYTLRDGALLRHTWAERNLDLVPGKVSRRVLVRGIDGLGIRFLPGGAGIAGGDWKTGWPVDEMGAASTQQEMTGPASTLPLAVTLTLQTEALGDVERIFTLPGV